VSVLETLSVVEPAAPSKQSLLALGWLNCFLSSLQVGHARFAGTVGQNRRFAAVGDRAGGWRRILFGIVF
jgi:hypothetical protein